MSNRPAGFYTIDERVAALLSEAAAVLLRSALGDEQHWDDSGVVLRDLERLATRAEEGKAAAVDMVERDGWPIFDPAGQTVILTMWHAVMDELGEREWNRVTRQWRTHHAHSPTPPDSNG